MPRTYTAFSTLTDKSRAEALGEAIEALKPEPTGVGVFEIEDGSGRWEVGGYFLEAPDAIELALLSAAYDGTPFVVSEVPDTDWVDKVRRELTPVRAGRFFVYGSHDADKVPADAEPLLIEAAMAFGTGHHGTTQGCLEALDRLVVAQTPVQKVADIGCGTAVLAMAAARVWGIPAIASDIDEVAVEVAVANVAANGLADQVHCVEAAGFDHPDLATRAPYDLIFANILKAPLIELAPHIAQHLAPKGHAILSGLLTRQADDVRHAYDTVGLSLVHHDTIGDWATLTVQKIRE